MEVPDNGETLPGAAIQRRKLSDEVLERLLQLIESGHFQPGDKLPSERELMAKFQVGRPAVREALQSLQQMSRITISHGERARVVSLTPDLMFEQIGRSARHLLLSSPKTLEQLKEARLMFELAMVRLAVPKVTDEDLAKLKSTIDDLASARKADGEFMSADMAFHQTIAAISGNPIFAAVSTAMLGWLADFHAELLRAYGAEDVTVNEHIAIFERIADRDVEGAVQAMSDHLTRASALYRTGNSKGRRNASN
jgi:DNA-binding FadR family transcriptional regulator